MSVERRIRIANGLNLAVKTWGNPDQTPLLAIHGWLDNANSFIPLAPLLSQVYFVIAPDLIGHGLSDHIPSTAQYHFIDSINHLIGLTKALNLKYFSLLGHSMGAALTPLLAAAFPEKVVELFLIEGMGPLSEQIENTTSRLRKACLFSQRQRQVRVYKDYTEAIYARMRNNDISLNAAQLIVERGLHQQAENEYVWRHDPRLLDPSVTRLTQKQILNFFQHIICPVRSLWAIDGMKFPTDLINQRLQAIRNLQTFSIKGNHHVHMDEPQQVADIIFLD